VAVKFYLLPAIGMMPRVLLNFGAIRTEISRFRTGWIPNLPDDFSLFH
jgi:hypothetical protein